MSAKSESNSVVASVARLGLAAMGLLVCLVPQGFSSAPEWAEVKPSGELAGLKITGRIIPQEGAVGVEAARIPGRVLSLGVREGQKVQVGSLLFSISSPECTALRQEKKLAMSKGLTELIESARAREKQLGLKIENDACLILSHYNGTVTKRNIEMGTQFNVGDTMVTVVDMHRLAVEIDVSERDLPIIYNDQEVNVELASVPGVKLKGRIVNILPTVDPVSRSSKVRVQVPDLPPTTNMDALVFGEISLQVDSNLLRVPTTSLVFSHNRQYVVKKDDAKMIPVPVTVVSENFDVSSVRPLDHGKLKAGDLVLAKDAIYMFRKVSVGDI